MLIRWSAQPAEQMVDSWRAFNRLFDETYGGRSGDTLTRQGQWIPAAEVSEDERQFSLTLELPGVKPEEVRIDIEGNQLSISGERRFESGESTERFRRAGRRSFRRAFTLPDSVATEDVEASLADGILTVNLPKTERAKPRTIQVRNATRQTAGNGGTEVEPRGEVEVNKK